MRSPLVMLDHLDLTRASREKPLRGGNRKLFEENGTARRNAGGVGAPGLFRGAPAR